MPAKKKDKKRLKYSRENMKLAIEMVRSGKMSKKRAARTYGVPRTTLLDKLSGRVPEERKPGPDTVLTPEEESHLVRYINLMADIGYPLTRAEFLQQVKKVLDVDGRKTPFTNNLPGKGWYYLFRERHPEITERKPQLLGRERAAINYQMLKGWYSHLFDYMSNEVEHFEDIVKNPRRIFNADETGFPLCVTSSRVLSTVSSRHVYQVCGNNKTQVTVMACLNALGDYVPPLIVFPGQRFRNIGLSAFPEAIYGHTDNGWMDSELFLAFLKLFVQFVKDQHIDFPVILFVDGHSTHISLASSEYCAQNKIILYCLLPNATHILQACDIGLFSPMKTAWKKYVKEWQMEHIDEVFTKHHFPEVFRKTWYSVTSLENAVSAFKRSGLYPLTIEGLDLSKLGPSKISCAPPPPPVAGPAAPPANTITVIAEVHRSDIPETQPGVSAAFDVLRLPAPKVKNTKSSSVRQKIPKALSGREALSLLREREEQKEREEEQKNLRKAERESKRKERIQLMAKKKEEREKRQRKKENKKQRGNNDDELELTACSDGEKCEGCKTAGGRDEDWVGCDSCMTWWHIDCTSNPDDFWGLSLEDTEDREFICNICKTFQSES